MKKLFMAGTAVALAIVGMTSLSAQDNGTDGAEGAETTQSNGAIVTRENIEEEREVLDDNGDPVLNEDGTPRTETVTTGFTQTVETPSGNVHIITKEDGGRAIVTHERADRPEKPSKPERASKPERPERPEKPERPDRPEKPEKPERPGKPG
jgi:hypothetical protein